MLNISLHSFMQGTKVASHLRNYKYFYVRIHTLSSLTIIKCRNLWQKTRTKYELSHEISM